MFVEIIKNTDGFVGATCIYRNNYKDKKLYEMDFEDIQLLQNILIGRDGVEINNKDYDIEIRGLRLKLNDNQNRNIAKEIKGAFKYKSSPTDDDKMINQIYTDLK